MSGLADSIRRFVVEKYILPATRSGYSVIKIRAGDVHRAMGLVNRVPAVITALGSRRFIEFANDVLRDIGYCIRLVSMEGPRFSTTTTFTYEILSAEKCLVKANSGSAKSEFQSESFRASSLNEDVARRIISEFLSIPLYKERIDIFGKLKEFDLVNIGYRVIGDIKGFTYSGPAAAEFSNIIEYVWLMEKLEKYTNVKWRKIIVGYGRREIFERFRKRYDPWLEDLEIYFIDEKLKVHKIR